MQSAVNSAASRMIMSLKKRLNCAVQQMGRSVCMRMRSTALLQMQAYPANRTGFHHKTATADRHHGVTDRKCQASKSIASHLHAYVLQQIKEPSYSHDTNKQTTRKYSSSDRRIDRFCSHLLFYNVIWESVHTSRSHRPQTHAPWPLVYAVGCSWGRRRRRPQPVSSLSSGN